MARKTNIFQIGGPKLTLTSALDSSFHFQYFELMPASTDLPTALFEHQHLQRQYADAVFILGRGSAIFALPQILIELPANRLIYDARENLPTETALILKKKGAVTTDLVSGSVLTEFLNQTFFGGQLGTRLNFNRIEVAPLCRTAVTQLGRGQLTLSQLNFERPTQVLNWRQGWLFYGNTNLEFWPEFELHGSGQAIFKIFLLDLKAKQIFQSYQVTSEQLQQPFYFKTADQITQVYLTVLLEGEIASFSVREMHFRQARPEHGNFMVNSTMITDRHNGHGQLAVYFDAGNFQPPLNIYFSGFRTAEGFEGAGMMSQVGGGNVPHLLIADERLEGGAFYLGDADFEEQVRATIAFYLNKLGFSPQQLILSGLSMGTTAALYYAAMLNPAAVIVGKPLVNLGNIAHQERLERPGGFPTSLDLLLLNTGATNLAAQNQLNQHFWQTFKQGQFAQTTFALAYMENDDYDRTAFADLTTYLRAEFPTAKILHKGIPGRHNDDTPGIVAWFLKQYEHILATDFGRKEL